jgi:solute carrier family 25 (adenine nucleotide translocator) protein 4/5/6/31
MSHNRDTEAVSRGRFRLFEPEARFAVEKTAAMAWAAFVTAPLKRVRILQQTEVDLFRTERISERLGGIQRTWALIVAREGHTGLWRGALLDSAAAALAAGTALTTSRVLDLLWREGPQPGEAVTPWRAWAAPLSVAAALAATQQVLELARTRVAADLRIKGYETQFRSGTHVLLQVARVEGARALFTGVSAGLVGGALFWAARQREPLGTAGAQHFAFVAAASVLAHPFDTVRRRLMVTTLDVKFFRGAWDCARSVAELEGPSALFRGAFAGALRVGALAALFRAVEIARGWPRDPRCPDFVAE